MSAHQALLVQSPFFAAKLSQQTTGQQRIELPEDDLPATASFLEYLYKGDYFPALSSANALEYDNSIPLPDERGIALLRHARIYTLAKRFGIEALATLARRKIHVTKSTARGEIAYARYVYGNPDIQDESVKKPIVSFWASRSYVLRHEAEGDFKKMCLDYPQFGFDVLSLVLDAQEKRTQRQETSSQGAGSARKRARNI